MDEVSWYLKDLNIGVRIREGMSTSAPDQWVGYQVLPKNPPRSYHPPALPPYEQLNLFEFHGINPYVFRTPLSAEAAGATQ